MFKEAEMTANGLPLSHAESMTIRVALIGFADELQEGGLGDDEHGQAMTKGYLSAIRATLIKMGCVIDVPK